MVYGVPQTQKCERGNKMYKNLLNSMKSKNITLTQLSELLNVRLATISDKVNGKSRFYFDEAIKIKKVFFPEYEVEFLFEFDEEAA